MDWLDSYLDNLSDGRNAIYPPDKNTWTPIKPNRQQQSMIKMLWLLINNVKCA